MQTFQEKIQLAEKELAHAPTAVARIDALHKLAWKLRERNLSRATVLIQEARHLTITQTPPYQRGLADNQLGQAYLAYAAGQYDMAERRINDALAIYQTLDLLEGQYQSHRLLARTLVRLGNYADAMQNHLEQLRLSEQLPNPERRVMALAGIGLIYNQTHEPEAALNYHLEALRLAEASGLDYDAMRCMVNTCWSYLRLNEHEQALSYGHRAVTQAEQLDAQLPLLIAHTYLAEIYLELDDLPTALFHLQTSRPLLETVGTKFAQVRTEMLTGIWHLKQNQLDEAETVFKLALCIAEETNQKRHIYDMNKLLADVYEKQGRPGLALQHFRTYHHMHTAVFNEEAQNKLSALNLKHQAETAQKEAEIYQLRYVELQQEIAERERTEQALIQAQKLESLGILAGGVAHDFNNLLVGILGQATLLRHKLGQTHPYKRHVSRIIEAADRAAVLAGQMLAYSGHGHFEVVTCHLNTILQENQHLLNSVVGPNVCLTLQLAEGLPHIKADANQLYQVVMNLMLNAAEAGATQVKVRTYAHEFTNTAVAPPIYTGQSLSPGSYVALQIQDNGEGMSQETQQKLFDPFYTTKSSGHGLGLAAVLGIVRGHQGGIDLCSTPGQGTTFTLFWPV